MECAWPLQALREELAPLMPGVRVELAPEIDSTNSELMRRARAGSTQPVLLVAERQTAGRGRRGRAWQADPGDSLTFSLGLPLAPREWSGLSLAVGVAVAEMLHPAVGLKWPNDLWVGGHKLGGILVETAGTGEALRQAVVGVGINIAPRDGAGLSTPPAALRALWPQAQAGEVLLRVAAPLARALREFEQAGFGAFVERYRARDLLWDTPVTLSDGRLGTACGVSGSGGLLVHTAAGTLCVTSEEVSVRPA
ncbi:biotin--[acetyl-CoA-carboxylase] ligase [Ramlibacter rhizophilus]|uniref:Biotin--[acetyl-CoA-carboxylase] ligase n=1 Tax=Ramlibacter rhizophilus TaxID=1781167 RepID=A0A4Z0BJ40_9BURK|nr:biotin--[acetyl-CoA-carboxylase] ligase [Ramlibacter rhizophilus]TFY97918.1 biotin--[acetyl-CoA-carboxylase] ligase [Ramlibacter rhizophilus]